MHDDSFERRGRGEKADAVGGEVLRILALEGEVMQNNLIDLVSDALNPRIGRGSVNSLTRRFLDRERGRFVALQERGPPKRKYWSLTSYGLNHAYGRGKITLHELSDVILKTLDRTDPLYPFYNALALSRGLADMVAVDLDEYDRSLEALPGPKHRPSAGPHVTIEVNIIAEKAEVFRLSVIEHLAGSEVFRREVGKEAIEMVCREQTRILDVRKNRYEKIERYVKGLRKRVLVELGQTNRRFLPS